METEGRVLLADVFASISDPRQAKKRRHDLAEMLVAAVCAVLAGADNFVETEMWAREMLEWIRRYLKLENGIAPHETVGRLSGLIDGRPSRRRFAAGSAECWRRRRCGQRWQDQPAAGQGR